ncbi:hypothetical protein IV203_017129 [Nitzschia inconspicua]|uniref:Uncharacterized protein n=1 Tax=Nitzschia inconspicua TaxID=303405 RepID=A0A9K3KR34_9STRA|nr:hypothetical protein IV203_017129 [Nitzschia inconspicua]
MKAVAFLLLSLSMAAVANAFFQQATASKSKLTQQAVDIFGEKFPYNQPPRKKWILDQYVSLGVPKTDIDGTRYDKVGKGNGKRLTDITEKQAADAFNQIASLYGGERAIEMVKIFPICLAFDKTQFKDSFAAWSGIFGEEETKEMVLRNPGLLAVRAAEAAKASDQTMVFSYIVAATRPIGKAGPIGIMLLVTVPFIEAATGISIREPFLATFGINI